MNTNPNWLDASDWKWVQDTMPIACADAVPVRVASNGKALEKIGLIFRDTPHQGKRWCMVGGRMHRDESMAAAITRQLRETLGPHIQFEIGPDRQPDFVAQYFTALRENALLDPRQHALTMAFVVPVNGEIIPLGEAERFQWFDPNHLPPADEFGFEQNRVIDECLKRWTGLRSK